LKFGLTEGAPSASGLARLPTVLLSQYLLELLWVVMLLKH
jgi:hypothetical protein